MDKYTKVVLTLIAFALWANLFVGVAPHGALIRDANGQTIIGGVSSPLPVYLTPGPANSTHPTVVSVNIVQLNSQPFQRGWGLPVDIEAIAAGPVKQGSGLPVDLATQVVAVTTKGPLPVTLASLPLPVSAKDPLPVLVTKLPPPAVTSTPSQ